MSRTLNRLLTILLTSIALSSPTTLHADEATLAGKRCPAGSVVKGFSAAGELECVALPSVSCPAGEHLRGVNVAAGTPTCAKLKDRFYTRRSGALASVGLAGSPLLYTATASCDEGDVAIAGGGRCAASNYGMTASFPALVNGELGSRGALSAGTGSTWRFFCSLQTSPGATSFAHTLCLKQ